MKYIIASLAIGACLVLPSAEAVFATEAPASCGDPGAGFAPGNSAGAINSAGTNGSPFAADTGAFTKNYAGSGSNPTAAPGHPNSSNAASHYDIACANVSTKSQGHKTQLP
jgi:hypothetical protein